MRLLASVLVVLAACGEDAGDKKAIDAKIADGKPIDAMIDAMLFDAPPDAQAFVLAVTCPLTTAATVTTSNFMFVQSATTLAVNDIVEFSIENIHSVVPHPMQPTDPGLQVGPGQTKCLQFTIAGTFNWRCGPHPSMVGAFTVN